MTTIAEVNYNEIIQKVKDLPDSLQIHFIEYLKFLHLKYKKKISDNAEELEIDKDREELQSRIQKAKDHPETLVTWESILTDLEGTFGREIKIH